jgi:hypothetical protein
MKAVAELLACRVVFTDYSVNRPGFPGDSNS